MKRTKLHWGMASVGLLAGIALTGLVGYSIGGDEPDVSDLTRPKEPKTRVYDSRIQIHRMDWTFEGDEVLYRRKRKNQPALPSEVRDTGPPVDSELRDESMYTPPPVMMEDPAESKKRNWILPPAPEGSEEASPSASPWDTLTLKPAETPEVTNPYATAPTNTSSVAEDSQQQFHELTEHFLMSDEDIAALAEARADEQLRDDEYQPTVNQSSFGGGSVLGFGTSLLSRDGDDQSDEAEYGGSGQEGTTETAGIGTASERSLSERLGVARSGEALQLTRRTLGFAGQDSGDPSPDSESGVERASVDSDGWRGVFKGIGGNLQRPDSFGAETVETTSYGQETVPAASSFFPSGTSDSYSGTFPANEAFAPAGNADRGAGTTYRSTEFGPTTVDRFSFSGPSFESEGFSATGEGQQRLRESAGTSQSGSVDPFARFNNPSSSSSPIGSSSGKSKDAFRIMMR